MYLSCVGRLWMPLLDVRVGAGVRVEGVMGHFGMNTITPFKCYGTSSSTAAWISKAACVVRLTANPSRLSATTRAGSLTCATPSSFSRTAPMDAIFKEYLTTETQTDHCHNVQLNRGEGPPKRPFTPRMRRLRSWMEASYSTGYPVYRLCGCPRSGMLEGWFGIIAL